ncbi:MAG: MBL fold metallo-hydrolase [Aquisalinus sp.]|nr:MBL fold metallo-hydrolase [Aquisalinus sp.]
MLEVKSYFDPATATVTYLIWDTKTSEAAIIDPVLDFETSTASVSTKSMDVVLRDAAQQGLSLKWILETHAHADHLSAACYIRENTDAKIGIGARITDVQEGFRALFNATDVSADGQVFDALFEDEDELMIGDLSVRVLHTPGHTPACVSYLVADAIFVGDTLFMPDFGTARTDFPGGDAATLYRSIQRLLSLPPETRMFVGHDYLPEGRDNPAWETTVSDQRGNNIHVGDGVTEEEFVKKRTARDATLSAPGLILPSLQVNIRAGAMPPVEADGHVYLKLPINRLN